LIKKIQIEKINGIGGHKNAKIKKYYKSHKKAFFNYLFANYYKRALRMSKGNKKKK